MNSKTNIVRAILLDASECDHPEADHPATIEICADDLQRILERHITEPAQCLHQITEPAQTGRPAFEAISQFMKCEWSLNWDKAGFYSDVKVDAAFTWFEKGYMHAQHAAAPQAVQPAIMPKGESAAAQLRAMATNYPAGHSWDKLDARACIRGALEIEALRALLAAAPAHPAEGVPDPALSRACDLLSMTIGTLMGFRAKVGYTDNSPIAGLVNDAVEFLQPWPEKLPTATQPAAQGLDAQNLYYLQDARHHSMVGNCPSFWRPDGNGYTTNLDEAERFTFEEAMKQHKRRETDLPWLCTEVDKLRRPTVDCQYMPRSWDAQRAALAAKQGEKL